MPVDYRLRDASNLPSPALLFYPDLIQANLQRMIEMAGSPTRLRPHAKTHKCAEIIRRELALGITKHKCATLREAQMLAQCGVPDVLIAYQLVGPAYQGLVKLLRTFPQTRFAVLTDDLNTLQALAAVLDAEQLSLDVMVDINVGQHRTGVSAATASVFFETITKLPGGSMRAAGIHVYDGHNFAPDRSEREGIVTSVQEQILALRHSQVWQNLSQPRIVLGGTPAFMLHAQLEMPEGELSPGTCVLHDGNYRRDYPELGFTPAAVVLTRCVSRPTPHRVTFDLGTKAVCADPPAGKRCVVLGLENAVAVAHNEEHLVLETPEAEQWQPGMVAYAVPAHICPTVAHYRFAQAVRDGQVIESWEITARDRELTI